MSTPYRLFSHAIRTYQKRSRKLRGQVSDGLLTLHWVESHPPVNFVAVHLKPVQCKVETSKKRRQRERRIIQALLSLRKGDDLNVVPMGHRVQLLHHRHSSTEADRQRDKAYVYDPSVCCRTTPSLASHLQFHRSPCRCSMQKRSTLAPRHTREYSMTITAPGRASGW